ncbi:unnamed protein product [Bursaphelenchus okinawaensis]|uniref:Uncharacterized protein n=1 Tax=Bursaphelenchus okinawaensis TaxID=465554 RepID=A0A811KTN0_9BILA|nr:unnamed protein product [Bursaphelenchus okinawaensis]CAG9111298.1 unnamed protein product [Bursaphelenchus okinawaensis]
MTHIDSFEQSTPYKHSPSTSFATKADYTPTSYFGRSPGEHNRTNESSLVFSKKGPNDDSEYYSSTIIRIYNKYVEKVEHAKVPLYKRVLHCLSGVMSERKGKYTMVNYRLPQNNNNKVSFISYRRIRD